MSRLSLVVALCVVLAALVVGFGMQFNGSDTYPDAREIGENYPAYVGERVHLWVEVAAVEDGTVVGETGGLRLAVTDPPPEAVAVGDSVQVYGTLTADRRLETVAYHTQTLDEVKYMYGVSVLGGILAAGLFLRRWRVDTENWQFVPREGT